MHINIIMVAKTTSFVKAARFSLECSVDNSYTQLSIILAGLFTGCLANHLATEELLLRDMLDRVGTAVMMGSGGLQTPVCAQ